MKPLQDFTKTDIIALIPITLGIILLFMDPENIGGIFLNTSIAVILIKLFWK